MMERLKLLGTRKIIILVIMSLAVVRMLAGTFSYFQHTPKADSDTCQSVASDIRQWISSHSTCDQDSDCMTATLNCPFNCNTYLHIGTDVTPLRSKIAAYNEQCGFCVEECSQQTSVCIKHQCITPEAALTPKKH